MPPYYERLLAPVRRGQLKVDVKRLHHLLIKGDDGKGAFDDHWRLLSILAQLARGHFDDVPDLATLAASQPTASWPLARAAHDVLGHAGDAELDGFVLGCIAGEDRLYAREYWTELSLVPSLIAGFEERAWPGDLCFIYPSAIR